MGINKLKNIPSNLSNLKSKADKLDVYNLIPVLVDLSKLSDAVKNDDKIEYKIPDITNLKTNTTFNAKINEVKGKIPSITNLPTTTALIAIENKISNASNLVKKTDCNTKINETEKKITDHDHDKYITTPELNKLTAENFVARLAQVNLASKNDIAILVKGQILMIN